MRENLGEALGDEIDYKISIKEKIGTETLASIKNYSPSVFSDGTKEIQIRWNNGYQANCRLDIAIHLDGSFISISGLTVECTAPMARETAIGVGEAVMRLLKSHGTYSWVFSPSQFPILPLVAAFLAISFLSSGSTAIVTNQKQSAFYLLFACVVSIWFLLSGVFFRRRVSFDTRGQRLLDRVWQYFSLGTLGFVLFGTLLPLLRKTFFGF
jgi:hypothetical protein